MNNIVTKTCVLTVLHCVDPNAIGAIRLDGLVDPGIHEVYDILILRVEIHESYVGVAKGALFHIGLMRVIRPEFMGKIPPT